MIVTRIIGGLGNQMFQYAAGRALALRRNSALKIDRRAFADYETHAFGLGCFRAPLEDAPQAVLPGAARESRVHRLLRGWFKGSLSVHVEREFTFDPGVLDMLDDTYLDGYWQSEKYFADHAADIRADFTVRHAPSPANAAWLERLTAVPSVSLHVRRGDYVTNPAANAVHGTCDLDYYRRAVGIVQQATGIAPELFVFSDDPDWVAANLDLPQTMHLVRNNDAATNYEDLRLMSACRHHVIANSSFSWWGAWLDAKPDAIVVAPQRWFAADKPDARDLVPERWIRT